MEEVVSAQMEDELEEGEEVVVAELEAEGVSWHLEEEVMEVVFGVWEEQLEEEDDEWLLVWLKEAVSLVHLFVKKESNFLCYWKKKFILP